MGEAKGLRGCIAVLWCCVVAGAYYALNFDYYVYKISVFGRFFLRALG